MNKTESSRMLILSMLIFGTIGIFRKYIPLPSQVLAMARGFIGAGFLIVYALLRREKLSFPKTGRIMIPLIVSGAFIGLNWVLLFEAYRYTSVAAATLCYYMAPVFVILLSPFVLKEKITKMKLFCVTLSLGGMVLVSGVLNTGFSRRDELTGILFGLGAACFYAMVIIMNKKMPRVNSNEKTIIQLLSAAAVLVPYCLLSEDFSAISLNVTSVLLVLAVGILHTGIAYALYFASMKGLDGQAIALYSYIDPATAIILSALVLKEGLDLLQITGAVIILGSCILCDLTSKN